jgi:hypothetical protein
MPNGLFLTLGPHGNEGSAKHTSQRQVTDSFPLHEIPQLTLPEWILMPKWPALAAQGAQQVVRGTLDGDHHGHCSAESRHPAMLSKHGASYRAIEVLEHTTAEGKREFLRRERKRHGVGHHALQAWIAIFCNPDCPLG